MTASGVQKHRSLAWRLGFLWNQVEAHSSFLLDLASFSGHASLSVSLRVSEQVTNAEFLLMVCFLKNPVEHKACEQLKPTGVASLIFFLF